MADKKAIAVNDSLKLLRLLTRSLNNNSSKKIIKNTIKSIKEEREPPLNTKSKWKELLQSLDEPVPLRKLINSLSRHERSYFNLIKSKIETHNQIKKLFKSSSKIRK